MKVATGTYTGNGTDGTGITGVGFQPDLVIIKRGGSGHTSFALFKTSSIAGDATSWLTDANIDAIDLIQSLDSDGFTIGADAQINASGGTYLWFAAATDSSANLTVGSYGGNGADDRNITGVGFQADFLMIKSASTDRLIFRHQVDATDICHLLAASAGGTNRIQSVASDGFQVGNDAQANANGVAYRYVAMKELLNPGVFSTGTYTGDGAASRSITGVGFQPEFVIVKDITTETNTAIMRFTDSSGTASQYADNSSDLTSQGIESFIADGFTIGSNDFVNKSGDTFVYMAWNKTADQTTTSTTTTSTSTSTSSSTTMTGTSTSTSTTTSTSSSTSTSTTSTSTSTTTTSTSTSTTSTSTSTTSTSTTSTSSTTTMPYSIAVDSGN